MQMAEVAMATTATPPVGTAVVVVPAPGIKLHPETRADPWEAQAHTAHEQDGRLNKLAGAWHVGMSQPGVFSELPQHWVAQLCSFLVTQSSCTYSPLPGLTPGGGPTSSDPF